MQKEMVPKSKSPMTSTNSKLESTAKHLESKPKDTAIVSMLPKLKKPMRAFGRTDEYSSKVDPAIKVEDKVTPPTIEQKAVGLTAGFAMEETYRNIQTKLESAERRATTLIFGKTKKEIKQFEAVDTIPEVDDDFKLPTSGTSSRVKSGKLSTKTE